MEKYSRCNSFIYTEFQAEEDIKDIIEETFDLCSSNREEICWLITILRGFMGIPNKRTDYNQDNFMINEWQLNLYPIFQRYKKKYSSLPYDPPRDEKEMESKCTNGGKRWYNDGKIQVLTDVCPLGFKPGMLQGKFKKKRRF